MQKSNEYIAANEKIRYGVAWTLIILIAACLASAILYNSNAVMMAFGKGELHFRSYNELVEKIESQPFDYTILSFKDNQEGSTVKFQNNNQTGVVKAYSSGDRLSEIDISVNRNNFFVLNPFEKYAFIDQMLRPILKSKDVLAAEIAILQYLSQYALQFKFIDSPQKIQIQADEFTLDMNLSEETIFLTITPTSYTVS